MCVVLKGVTAIFAPFFSNVVTSSPPINLSGIFAIVHSLEIKLIIVFFVVGLEFFSQNNSCGESVIGSVINNLIDNVTRLDLISFVCKIMRLSNSPYLFSCFSR